MQETKNDEKTRFLKFPDFQNPYCQLHDFLNFQEKTITLEKRDIVLTDLFWEAKGGFNMIPQGQGRSWKDQTKREGVYEVE